MLHLVLSPVITQLLPPQQFLLICLRLHFVLNPLPTAMPRCTERTSIPKFLNCIKSKPPVTSRILVVTIESSFGRQWCHLEVIQKVSVAAGTCSMEQQLTVDIAIRNGGLCLTFWGRNYFFLIWAHSVYKMWIIQEPNTLQLWNKLHFE